MTNSEIELSIYQDLQERYREMIKGTPSEDRVNAMMREVVYNHEHWPLDKTGRWVGYVQCILIEVEKVTTVNEERDYTRPLFHKLYECTGLKIPETIEIDLGR